MDFKDYVHKFYLLRRGLAVVRSGLYSPLAFAWEHGLSFPHWGIRLLVAIDRPLLELDLELGRRGLDG